MIFTGLRAGSLELIERDGKGRSGREAGNACWREGKVRGWADAASGEDTRGRDATGLKGEGTGATAVMTAGGEKLVRNAMMTQTVVNSLIAGVVGTGSCSAGSSRMARPGRECGEGVGCGER